MRIRDWSSDVCSSDLPGDPRLPAEMLRGMREVLLLGDVVRVDDVEDAAVCRVLLRGQQDRVHDVVHVNQRDRAPAAADGDPASGERDHAVGRAPFRSEEHTSELQSLMRIPYAVCGLKNKK